MTATIEDDKVAAVEAEDTKGKAQSDSDDDDDDEDSKSRDFTKFTKTHEELAAYINGNEDFLKAELGEVSPGLVKAVFALRTDFNNTPERKAAAAERKRKREEEKQKYAGLTAEEIKAIKAYDKAQEQQAKLKARVDEALAKAAALRESKDASGADVAAAVNADQGKADAPAQKKTIGRK